MITQEHEYYLRFILLLIQGGTEVLREIAAKAIQKCNKTLHQFLSENESDIQKTKDLSKKQKDILYPDSNVVSDIKDFDITLLSYLITKFLTGKLESNESNAVNKVRQMRNDYHAHSNDAKMSFSTYTKEWNKLTSIIFTIRHNLPEEKQGKLTEIIDSIAKDPLDIKVVIDEIEKLDQTNDFFQNIQKSLDDLQNIIPAISHIQKDILEIKFILENQGKTSKSINTVRGIIKLSADDQETIDYAEKVLLEASKNSVEKSPTENNKQLKEKVDKFVEDVEEFDIKVKGVSEGSVVFEFKCFSLSALLSLIDYFNSSPFQARLREIAATLEEIIGKTINVSGLLDVQSFQDVTKKFKERSHEKIVQFEMSCTGVDGLLHALEIFEGGKAANSLNELSTSLSESVGKPVTLNTSIDMEQVQRAIDSVRKELSDLETVETCVDPASTTTQDDAIFTECDINMKEADIVTDNVSSVSSYGDTAASLDSSSEILLVEEDKTASSHKLGYTPQPNRECTLFFDRNKSEAGKEQAFVSRRRAVEPISSYDETSPPPFKKQKSDAYSWELTSTGKITAAEAPPHASVKTIERPLAKASTIKFSHMKPPPLIKLLKNILSEYPDGGQILKEMIQNAEDAGATEFKVLYDQRILNRNSTESFTKFFVGPALCVYNNSVFTYQDWEGIQMIYSSLKETNRLKVGKFGLGFKSVFHMTDYPCIISGTRLLMIDPQQMSDKVNACIELIDLDNCKDEGLHSHAFWAAFGGIFHIDRNTLSVEGFPGTIFRFPLRETPSEISDTVYNANKITNLCEVLRSESSNILIFLQNIEQISIESLEDQKPIEHIFTSKICDPNGEVRAKRSYFKLSTEKLSPDYDGQDKYYAASLKIHTHCSGIDDFKDWIIVHYLVGENMSKGFRQLASDKSFGYNPIVGVAAPLFEASENFEGHIFCFLPLPNEGERSTGLPVHVNGFFALSQNRHHMKWETDEQKGKQVDDKTILWNKALLSEALPRAYEILILEAISFSESTNNTDVYVKAVYKIMPTSAIPSDLPNRWSELQTQTIKRLESKRILFAESSKKWIPIKDAYFATFQSEHTELTGNAVISCMRCVGLEYVDVPLGLYKTLKRQFDFMKDLTPSLLSEKMRTHSSYEMLSDSEKILVQEFLLKDGKIENLNLLKLLPLASGEWTVFKKENEIVYLCSEDKINILPGLENKLVSESVFSGYLQEVIQNIANSKVYQIRKLDKKSMKCLISEVIQQNSVTLSDGSVRIINELQSAKWLDELGIFIFKEDSKANMKLYRNVPFIPRQYAGTWSELLKLSDVLLLQTDDGPALSRAFFDCFKAMGVQVLENVPEWIPISQVKDIIHRPDSVGIASVLDKISQRSRKSAVDAFNNAIKSRTSVIVELKDILAKASLNNFAADMILELNIFKCFPFVTGGSELYTSFSVVQQYVLDFHHNIPKDVDLPEKYIIIDRSDIHIVSQLDKSKTEEVVLDTVILKAIQSMIQSQNQDTILNFMNYFCEHFFLFESNSELCRLASLLPFLKAGGTWHTPSNLFDPSDESLKKLFLGEHVFPEEETYSPERLQLLRCLGLKESNKISGNDLLKVATQIDQWSKNESHLIEISVKSEEFMKLLLERNSYLDEVCGETNRSLSKSIEHLECIPVKSKRPVDYPLIIPWFSENMLVCKPAEAKTIEMYYLIGATTPLVECSSDQLKTLFNWDSIHDLSAVFKQLICVSQKYNIHSKPECLLVVQKIYQFFSKRSESQDIKEFHSHKVIWTGEGFEVPHRVYVNQSKHDLKLEPYFFHIPEEFDDLKDFFLHVGCKPQQNVTILVSVLWDIKAKYESSDQTIKHVEKDRALVLNILNHLSNEVKEGNTELKDITFLMLVAHQSSELLSLQTASSCVFDDFKDDEKDCGNKIFVVHPLVSYDVAKTLGVRTINKITLDRSSSELNFEDWGQMESLTTRIKTLISEGYRDGLSVPKEFIQNADDAGATVIKFLLDERDNKSSLTSLLSPSLKGFQGPSLWVYNDKQFTDEDFRNITELNAGKKADRADKIGKFGLGFCSVYNLSDLPSFISGQNMVIFDPQGNYLSEVTQAKVFGLRLNLSNRSLIRRYSDQFQPYSEIFQCNIFHEDFIGFDGTLFRIPLRTEEQAMYSKISNNAYIPDDLINLIEKVITYAGNMLLFTQNIQSLQIYHLSKTQTNPSKAELIFTINKRCKTVGKRETTNVLQRVQTIVKSDQQFSEIHEVSIVSSLSENALLKGISHASQVSICESTWIVSWALGISSSRTLSFSMKASLPLSAVAVLVQINNGIIPQPLSGSPYGFYQQGHVFCFLPLPIITNLPVHINGCFSISSDRQRLITFTEDERKDNEQQKWNKALLEDSLVEAHILLLHFLSENSASNYPYDLLWPNQVTEHIVPFKHSFYSTLIRRKYKLLRGPSIWHSLDEIVFLTPRLRSDPIIGDMAYSFLMSVPYSSENQLVEIRDDVLEALKESGYQKEYLEGEITEEQFLEFFIDNISEPYWKRNKKGRIKIIQHALKFQSENIVSKMRKTRCIPSDPYGNLCFPNELIDPMSEIRTLFEEADGRFPMRDLFDESDSQIRSKLLSLGMNSRYLPNELLLDRCRSLDSLINRCSCCAKERCLNLMQYLRQPEVADLLESDKDIISALKNIKFLPVLARPASWTFSFKSDVLQIKTTKPVCNQHISSCGTLFCVEKPCLLYRQSLHQCIGSVALFINETEYLIPEQLIRMIGVQSDVTVSLLIEQLNILNNQYENREKQFTNLQQICNAVYERLSVMFLENVPSLDTHLLQELKEKPVLLIDRDLVRPRNVAENVKEECRPEFYRLPTCTSNLRTAFKAFGVQQQFSIAQFLDVLKEMKNTISICSSYDLEKVYKLLLNVSDSMKRENIDFDNLEKIGTVFAPDVEGFLRPTSELFIENVAYLPVAELHALHGSIPPDLGRSLGVKTIKQKVVESFSKSFFTPFGQHEHLVTRLSGILEEYPCDTSIMKELLQNADDACATEVHFIKNYGFYPTEAIFGKPEIQGPSLCVYNDSYFTENDFEGIRKLGIGSKREDPFKTGQYGIGFNAVYHLTDIPGFLTIGPDLGKNGKLCLFDPMMAYLDGYVTHDNPGILCDVEGINKTFPNVLNGYPDISSISHTGRGTMFRFPLRQSPSEISRHVFPTSAVDRLIEEFKEMMSECLLFLKNVKTIKVSQFQNGNYLEEYSVSSTISQEDQNVRLRYFSQIKENIASNNKSRHNMLNTDPIESAYKLHIENSSGYCENWIVVNKFGIRNVSKQWDDITEALKKELIGLIPTAAVALRIPDEDIIKQRIISKCKDTTSTSYETTDNIKGKLYCFLPLPIKTGMPVHINGHFALDKARSKLITEGIGKQWNKFILRELSTRAWLYAIDLYKTFVVDKAIEKCQTETESSVIMEIYHEIFPFIQNAEDRFSRLLVCSFYEMVIQNKLSIFPSVLFYTNTNIEENIQREERKMCNVKYVSLANKASASEGVFNEISDYLCQSGNKNECHKTHQLTKCLKTLGIKIIETPIRVKHCMEQCDIGFIETCSPHYVVKFLSSFQDNTACTLVKINSPITETSISDIQSLKAIWDYIIHDDKLSDHINGLPLSLTYNNILKSFDVESPLYSSEMCKILLGSAGRFLHPELIDTLLQAKLFKTGVIQHFTVDGLADIMHETFDKSVLANGLHLKWNKQEPLNAKTLETLMQFIHISSRDRKNIMFADQRLFEDNLRKLGKWALLPCCYKHENSNVYELIPVNSSFHMFCKSHGNETIMKVVSRLNIPVLDATVFSNECLVIPLENMLPSTKNATDLLKCLLFYEDRLKLLDFSQSHQLLQYFSSNLIAMKKRIRDDGVLKEMLTSLPLFVSHQGKCVSARRGKDVIIFPPTMPSKGMEHFCERTGVLLLKDSVDLKVIFDFIGFTRKKDLEIYMEHILPNMHHLPQETWMIHIEFIKSQLKSHKQKSIQNLGPVERQILEQIKLLKFVNVSGVYSTVGELYDPRKEIFALMLHADKLLPEEFISQDWIHFMEILGLKMDPTDDLMVEFALQIESNATSLTEQVIAQSLAFTHFLFEGSWTNDTLSLIKNVKCVVPYQVPDKKRNIFPKQESEKFLICYQGATSSRFEDLCWTCMNLLQEIPKSRETHRQLGIFETPPIKFVIQHCQNICRAFKSEETINKVSKTFVVNQMETLYKYFMGNLNEKLKELKETPIIYLPGENEMVSADKIVMSLNTEESIEPYLYKVPSLFGPFEDLFIHLGSAKNVTLNHYFAVLAAIKKEFLKTPLSANKLLAVQKCFTNIVRLIDQEQTSFENISEFYLLDRNHVLRRSNKTVLVNNIELAERIGDKISLNYLQDFRKLGVKNVHDQEHLFLFFPTRLRPDILTEVVKESVSAENITTLESDLAQKIEFYIQSKQFVEGILRLVKEQMKLLGQAFDKNFETKICTRISGTKISRVSGMKTYLEYRGKVIPNTESDAFCFITSLQRGHHSYLQLYFQTENENEVYSDLIDENNGLCRLIDMCTDEIFDKKLSKHVASILRFIEKPSAISKKLDNWKITAFDSSCDFSASAFPQPGTYVEEKFYPFLEQGIVPFKFHEFAFVALEIEDDFNDEEFDPKSLKYIYVHIIQAENKGKELSNLELTYRVDVGYRSDVKTSVPITRLYRFKPKRSDVDVTYELHDIESANSSIEEDFRQVREMLKYAWHINDKFKKKIIRRLLMRWHPDRNRGNQEHARKLFNYVNEIILKLESNDLIDENTSCNTGQVLPDMSHSKFGTATETVHRVGSVFATAYYTNMRDYNMPTRSSNFSHYRAEEAIVRHIGEAKRWFRQAAQDFRAAKSSMSSAEEDQSYNWICYKCHQAAEKALKAAWFSKNANKATKYKHNLCSIANGLDEDGNLFEKAQILERLSGNYYGLRYPDAFEQTIPSEVVDKNMAENAMDVAKSILDLTSEMIF